MGESKGRPRLTYLGEQLDAALQDYLEKHGEKFAQLVRRAIAREIGRPELSNSVRMGRPPADPISAKLGGKKVNRRRKRGGS